MAVVRGAHLALDRVVALWTRSGTSLASQAHLLNDPCVVARDESGRVFVCRDDPRTAPRLFLSAPLSLCRLAEESRDA